MLQFDQPRFYLLCDRLAATDANLQRILSEYGYPPVWTRPNTFETLVLTILEQQVSLASAYAAYKRLKERLLKITPATVLQLSDEDLRSCSFSRQKVVYVRELARAIQERKTSLKKLEKEEDEVVRTRLKALKGIGDWTVDIYLLHALRRADVFPIGDLALVNAIRMLYGKALTKEDILRLAEDWRPYRSIATMLLWHFYIRKKNISILH